MTPVMKNQLIDINNPTDDVRFIMEERAALFGMTIEWDTKYYHCGKLVDLHVKRNYLSIPLANMSSLQTTIWKVFYYRRFLWITWLFWFPFWLMRSRRIKKERLALPARRREEEEIRFQKEHLPEVDKFLES